MERIQDTPTPLTDLDLFLAEATAERTAPRLQAPADDAAGDGGRVRRADPGRARLTLSGRQRRTAAARMHSADPFHAGRAAAADGRRAHALRPTRFTRGRAAAGRRGAHVLGSP